MRILGIDPGLRQCGWGMIDVNGGHLRHVGNGVVVSDASTSLAERLVMLYHGLAAVIDRFQPETAAVEETFVNKNPASTLKLGQARGIALLTPALAGLDVAEYSANLVKKSVVGSGHAGKDQIGMMVRILLPGCNPASADAADALAVAITHAHHKAETGEGG